LFPMCTADGSFGITMSNDTVAQSPANHVFESLMTCLWGEDIVDGPGNAKPKYGRMAAGGFSSGTDTLVNWTQTPLLDEIYAFDGTAKSSPLYRNFQAWVKKPNRPAAGSPSGKPYSDRRLRMIGTAYTEVVSIHIAQDLEKEMFGRAPGAADTWEAWTLPGH